MSYWDDLELVAQFLGRSCGFVVSCGFAASCYLFEFFVVGMLRNYFDVVWRWGLLISWAPSFLHLISNAISEKNTCIEEN